MIGFCDFPLFLLVWQVQAGAAGQLGAAAAVAYMSNFSNTLLSFIKVFNPGKMQACTA